MKVAAVCGAAGSLPVAVVQAQSRSAQENDSVRKTVRNQKLMDQNPMNQTGLIGQIPLASFSSGHTEG